MSVLWTAPEHATRYAPYVEELRDFFSVVRLHSGAPEDLVAVAGRLDASESFREDLSSMVRVILLREGGSVPRADLLEILTIAIGGAEIDHAPLEMQQAVMQQSIQQIFAFLDDVLRRPWNQAPGEERLEPPRLDAPDPAAASESASTPAAMPIPSPEATFLSTHNGVPIYGHEVAPAPSHEAASIVSPWATPIDELDISTREEPYPSPPGDEPASDLDEPPAFVRPESVYSRFTDLDTGTQIFLTEPPSIAAPDPGPPAAPVLSLLLVPEIPPGPEPAIAEEVPPPPEPLPELTAAIYASKVVPWPNPILEPPIPPASEFQHNLALEQFPNPAANLFFPPPIAAVPPLAAEPHPAPATPPLPPSTLDPEPPSPAVFHAVRLHKLNPKRAALRFPASPLRIALISGAAATLIVAALMYAAHRNANAVLQAASRPLTTPVLNPAPRSALDPDPPLAVATAPAIPAAAAQIPSTSTASPAVAHPQHAARRIRDDDYIAPPYSTPIPPELAVHASAPGPSSVASARLDEPDRPIAPDTASSPIFPPNRHLSVSSRELAILSAPPPGYPILAKIAHVQGQVVLQAEVDRDGTVSAAHVVSGHHLLRSAALDAVLRRRYRPYRVDGHPVEVSTTITLNFPSHR